MSLLIDVRTPFEFKARHVDGAVNIQLSQIMKGDLGMLADTPKDTEINLYCQSGGRSVEAIKILSGLGFTKLKNLGGIDELM